MRIVEVRAAIMSGDEAWSSSAKWCRLNQQSRSPAARPAVGVGCATSVRAVLDEIGYAEKYDRTRCDTVSIAPPLTTGPWRRMSLLETAEREAIIKALDAAAGNKSEAAKLLGMGRTTLYRKLRQLGLDTGEMSL